ncbi:MAG: chemotaxis protein CheX [Oryzomonas sp.]|uniref:chemotaxis protein CheX n=1 Tax=Oryzomonas sp. TaxID=2855186 RepID=UPI00283D1FC9|nr:chemotaxis protein CheX [Oryzomonas sp.]MDR3581183.1 chemotaxis protein CheX [Oryzomonas sp.]
MTLANGMMKSLNTTEDQLARLLMRDVKDIFGTMVGLEDLLHLPIQIDPVTNFTDCISSMVGLAGNYNGLVSLHMPGNLAIRATRSMLGMDVTEAGDDVNDALGEIANMIAGSFKQHLSKGGMDIHLSTPSVVYGKEYVITLGNNPDQIAVRFATGDDWFMVVVAFGEN